MNRVEPLGPSRTRVRFRSHVWDEEKLDRGAGAGLDEVEREDEEVVEAVQRGIRARLYDRARLHPEWEVGVAWFHGMLGAALAGC